jgi:hypothetical protein
MIKLKKVDSGKWAELLVKSDRCDAQREPGMGALVEGRSCSETILRIWQAV